MSKKLLLIDGHSILNRAFYGVPDLTNSEGLHTNAVYGFLNIMFKIMEEEKADYLTVAFDVNHPTFRHEMFKEYKGTRKPMPEELRQQVPMMKEVLHAMNIRIVERPGYEADDILGTLAKLGESKGYEVSLVSGDRDLLQLASEHIKIRIPKTKRGGTEIEDYHTQDVIDKYGVSPAQIIDLKGLMGDASDNIPGVPGIGEKTASKILGTFTTIENAYAHIDEVLPKKAKENLQTYYDQAQLSKVLATIKTDCDLDYTMEEARFDDMYNEEAFRLLKRLEFKNMLSRFSNTAQVSNDIEGSFRCITELSEAETYFADMKGVTGPIGCQIIEEQGQIYGISFSHGEDKVALLKAEGFITEAYLVDKVNVLVEEKKLLSVIGLKSQLTYIKANESSNIFDCAIAAYLLNPLKDTYHYDDVARDYLGMTVSSKGELFGKNSIVQMEASNQESLLKWCCYQSYVAMKAHGVLEDRLSNEGMLALFTDIEMPLVYTLYDMESRGIGANREALKEYGQQLAVRIDELEEQIHSEVGEKFNINSPKQLGVILFEKLQLPYAKKTKTGYSTNADILDKLKGDYPVVANILEFRQLTKLKSTYADGLAAYISEDGRIHGKFNQTITATGRISSTEPNLQNIPIRMELGRQIRKVFIPEEGYVFLDADYSQIELRVLAHMSGDDRLIQAYQVDEDIHRITASQVFNTPLNEVTSQQRRNAKAVNFGIIYGIGGFSLGQDLGISKKEADQYIASYFATYPAVKGFLTDIVDFAKKEGYSKTLYGRKRPIPELSSSNFMQKSFGERVAMNSPIQGTAADIIKLAMIHVNMELKEKGLRSRLLLQIHDELLVEAHKDEIEQVKEIMQTKMQQVADLLVPLVVEVNQGNNWYEAK